MWKFFLKHMTPCIVVFSIVTVLVYTVLSIVLTVNGVLLSDTLTEWVFKFFGLEMLALSGIKVSKHIGSAFGKLEEAVDGAVFEDDEPVG